MAKVSIKNLANAIYKSVEGKTGDELSLAIENSAKLIYERHLTGQSEQILSALERIIDEKRGILKAKVTSKERITPNNVELIKDFIKKKFKAKEIELETKEDNNILGGLKLEIGENMIDTTLKYKLGQLQNYLTKN